jgi:hypothetical protein
MFTVHAALFSTHAYVHNDDNDDDDGDTGRRVSPMVDITLSYCRVPEFIPCPQQGDWLSRLYR